MRSLFATLVLACASCGLAGEDHLAEAERASAELIARAEPKHTLEAFGGTLIGKDLGEWGGEVSFRPRGGSEYRVVDENSQGIFNMPYGVVAVTGLAHLDKNHGSIYVLSEGAGGRVSAARTLELPGWPCEVAASGAGIMLRVFREYDQPPDTPARPRYDCFLLQSPDRIVPTTCPVELPQGCFP